MYNITNSNCLQENLKEKEKLVAGPRWAPDAKTNWRTDCWSKCDFDFDSTADPRGGGLKYLHRSPESRKKRQKGNLVAGGITGSPLSEGYKYRVLARESLKFF
jgi:hypothetical protein